MKRANLWTLFVTALTLGLLLSASVWAENQASRDSQGRRLRTRRISQPDPRIPMSVDESAKLDLRASKSELPSPATPFLELGLLAAFSQTSGLLDNISQPSQGTTLGVIASAHFSKYFGADLDTYYTFPTSSDYQTSTESGFTERVSMSQFGTLINLRAQVPFFVGRVRCIPMVGAGWGFLSISHEETFLMADDSPAYSTLYRLAAPYAVAGLSVSPFEGWILSADFAKSAGGSGRAAMTSGLGSDYEQPLGEIAFDRLRTSLAYQVSRHATLGIQYSLRNTKYVFQANEGSDVATSLRQHQFSGFMLLNLF